MFNATLEFNIMQSYNFNKIVIFLFVTSITIAMSGCYVLSPEFNDQSSDDPQQVSIMGTYNGPCSQRKNSRCNGRCAVFNNVGSISICTESCEDSADCPIIARGRFIDPICLNGSCFLPCVENNDCPSGLELECIFEAEVSQKLPPAGEIDQGVCTYLE